MFRITDGKGLSVKFANGWAVSIQFGSINYCSNREIDLPNRVLGERGSQTAEIAVFHNGEFTDLPGGDIVGRNTSADDMLKIMNWAASQPA